MYDMHTHTAFSDDCDAPMEEVLQHACDIGLEGIAITDHYDPGYPDPEFPFIPDFQQYYAAMDRMKARYDGQLDVVRGMEIGIMQTQLHAAEDVAHSYDFDFLIGSFHCYRGEDIFTLDYRQRNQKELFRDFFVSMYECLKQYKEYDVIGHYTILDRYIGSIFDLTPAMDVIRETLKMIISEGKGIEINTSDKKYHMPVRLPRKEILEAYRELGGNILTIGSDSHGPGRLAERFDEALELAQSLGYRYWCSYRNRTPVFHKI